MNNIYYQRPNDSGKKKNNDIRNVDNQQNDSYYQPSYQVPRHEKLNRVVAGAQSPVAELVANIILVILSVLLVIAFITLVGELTGIDRYYERKAGSFWWDYDNGRYVDSIQSRYENTYNDVKETAELTQCYAVCEYFEAASLYKAAVHTGKEDKAMKYLETMAKAYSEMGDVSYLAEDIDARLGITDLLK